MTASTSAAPDTQPGTVLVTGAAGGMDGLWTYDADLFDGATVERLTACVEAFCPRTVTPVR